MIVKALGRGSAEFGSPMLGRFAILAGFLGFALTQTATITPDVKSYSPRMSTQVTVPTSPNATTVSVTETNSDTTTSEMANATPNATSDQSNTSVVTTSYTTAITKLLPTTPVTMTTSPSLSTPKQTTQPQLTTNVPPKSSPTKHQSPVVPIATTKGSDIVTPTGKNVPQGSTSNAALYLLLPLVVIAAVAMLVVIVSYLRKRIRLDKLRHQLLPLYNFDPQEGEDWETELLTEPRASSHTPLNTTKPLPTTTAIAEIPKLRFSPDTVDV